ncbi:MAG: hypothetical protein HC875_29580 [Anaerolineales bacterium]|nr:hypothetical protein [Anaerolineales bacterium]
MMTAGIGSRTVTIPKYYIKEVGNNTFTHGGESVTPGWSDYYLYNTVFSRMPNARLSFPIDSEYNLTKVNDAMVMASNAKLSNELIDAWTIWPLNETLTVDAIYGPINHLANWNNQMLYFQDNAFGRLSILERSLVQDSEGRELTLGEGDVLQRHDIVSSDIGCSTQGSLVATTKSVLWFDDLKKKMYRLAEGIEDLGIVNGMNSYLRDIDSGVGDGDNIYASPYKGFLMIPNPRYNEIWFTIKTGLNTGETLVYDEIGRNFSEIIDNNQVFGYILQDDILVSQRSIGALYIEDSALVPRCSFFGTIKDARIDVIINPAGNLVNTLTNLELTMEVLNSGGVNQYNETLTSLRVTNDYQDTGTMTLVPGTNIRRHTRTWRINAFGSQTGKARLRDVYAKVSMVHTNSTLNPRKVVMHDLVSVFALSPEAISTVTKQPKDGRS